MSNPQPNNGPPLFRPIPRRPFDLQLREPTPPDDDTFPPSTDSGNDHMLNLESLNSRLLNQRNGDFASDSTPISRTESAVNMTGSTLAGIYSPSIWGKDRSFAGGDEPGTPGTPWGTGAETPAKNLSVDEPNYEIQKERAQPIRKRSSLHSVTRPPPLSVTQRALYLGSRNVLLFGLGVLYGLLAAQLRDRQRAVGGLQAHSMLRGADGSYDSRYMIVSGVWGIVMGSLLPWFDSVWERAFGGDEVVVESAAEHTMGSDSTTKEPSSFTDWALAFRGIGAFVGIAFAIRKLPWDSTLQVSLTLALVNPVLWFLIDRSMPGFVLSVAAGLVGTAMMLQLRPDMLPSPANPAASPIGTYGGQYDNATANVASHFDQQSVSFGGVTLSQEMMMNAIWTWSVLFCCCVCFGNIGRWLALKRGVAARGRWAQRQ